MDTFGWARSAEAGHRAQRAACAGAEQAVRAGRVQPSGAAVAEPVARGDVPDAVAGLVHRHTAALAIAQQDGVPARKKHSLRSGAATYGAE